MKKYLTFPFYPILIAAYSVLFLFTANLGQIPLNVLPAPLLASMLFAVVFFLLCWLAIRNLQKAGLAAGLLLLLFYTFGHIYNLVGTRLLFGMEIGFVKLAVVFAVIALSGITLIIKHVREPNGITGFFNVIAVFFVVVSLFQIIRYQAVNSQKAPGTDAAQSTSDTAAYPDIYYIIVDGYTRQDALLDRFKYDNSEFLNALSGRGFFIPECAYSNYSYTSLSLASSLNMNYVEALGVDTSKRNSGKNDPLGLQNLIHHSAVRQELSQLGYSFYTFKGFSPVLDITDADYYFDVFEDDNQTTTIASLSFEHMYVKTTFIRVFVEYFAASKESDLWSILPPSAKMLLDPDILEFSSRSYKWYRQHVYTFDTLKEIAEMPGRKFVYAHVYATHQPYVFNSEGGFLWPVNEDNFNYIPAVEYTNGRMLEVIDAIKEKSETPPIIIIQADHGMFSGLDRNKILFAIDIPGKQDLLYKSITPVNIFRVVLSSTFGLDYELLPDELYNLDEATQTIRPLELECDR